MASLKEFSFYLEAWKYCMMRNYDLDRIKRLDWKTWIVEE
jgi:hypothetical protein